MSGFRNSYRLLAALLATFLLLAGCETVQPGAAVTEQEPQKASVVLPGPQPRQASEAENLISYLAQLRKLPGSELAREHDAARQAYGRARSICWSPSPETPRGGFRASP